MIRIASINLQGARAPLSGRLARIAGHVAPFDPHAIAVQEAVRFEQTEDTSYTLGRHLRRGERDFGTHLQICHLYDDRHPEGVSVYYRSPLKKLEAIVTDLNHGLEQGLRPRLPRFAVTLVLENGGARILLTSVHLDHDHDPTDTRPGDAVRLAQMKKLLKELDQISDEGVIARIIAGDFNTGPDSEVIRAANDHPRRYTNAFEGVPLSERATFLGNVGNVAGRSIDHLLVAGKAKVLAQRVMYRDLEASDHAGICVDIEPLLR